MDTPEPEPPRSAAVALGFVQRGFRRTYQLWLLTKSRFSPSERQRLFGLTILIGGVCGLVAVGFHEAIDWFTTLTVDNAFSVDDDSWVVWVIASVGLGSLVAGVFLYYLPGARGSGIPQVKVAYATSPAKLQIRDAIGKFALCTIQIGTGSSLGREGPTVQICSGVAKAMGRLAGVSVQNLKLLLPVGAAAGIAAAFNAPIAAVTFTIEEIVGNLDQTLLSGVIVAAALAAVVERSILGENPVFSIPSGYGLDHAESLVLYAALGVAAALMAVGFTESLLWLRRKFQGLKRVPLWARPAVGGIAVGVIAVGMVSLFHVRGVTGGGYEGLSQALSGNLAIEVLLGLGAAKLVATVLSYSTGGAGGIFAPSLFMGAMLGGAFGTLDVSLFGHGHNEVGAFALVGMGAVFAGVVRAPITSVLIIIEMTGGYGLTLPLMISNMMAYGVARQLRPTPIYEALLEQDGVHLHAHKATDAMDRLMIERIPIETTDYIELTPKTTAAELIAAATAGGRQELFPVLGEDRKLVGVITLDDLTALSDEADLEHALVYAADLMRPPVGLKPTDLASKALEQMLALGVSELPVLATDDTVAGLISEAAIAHEYIRARAQQRSETSQSRAMEAQQDDET